MWQAIQAIRLYRKGEEGRREEMKEVGKEGRREGGIGRWIDSSLNHDCGLFPENEPWFSLNI